MNLTDLGFNITEKQAELFEKYYEILISYNNSFNLTAITEKSEVYVKHFADSLLGAQFINGDFIDIGSGGGFPAIPLKIFNPELKATLLEATGKKCEFLRAVTPWAARWAATTLPATCRKMHPCRPSPASSTC